MDRHENHLIGEGQEDSDTSLANKLTEELLYTIENVERSARRLNNHKGKLGSRVQVLEQMILEAVKVNGLLKGMLDDVQSENQTDTDTHSNDS